MVQNKNSKDIVSDIVKFLNLSDSLEEILSSLCEASISNEDDVVSYLSKYLDQLLDHNNRAAIRSDFLEFKNIKDTIVAYNSFDILIGESSNKYKEPIRTFRDSVLGASCINDFVNGLVTLRNLLSFKKDITKSLFYIKLPDMFEEPGDKSIILKLLITFDTMSRRPAYRIETYYGIHEIDSSMLMSYGMVQKLSDFYKSYTYESETGKPYYKVLQEYNMRNSEQQ